MLEYIVCAFDCHGRKMFTDRNSARTLDEALAEYAAHVRSTGEAVRFTLDLAVTPDFDARRKAIEEMPRRAA